MHSGHVMKAGAMKMFTLNNVLKWRSIIDHNEVWSIDSIISASGNPSFHFIIQLPTSRTRSLSSQTMHRT